MKDFELSSMTERECERAIRTAINGALTQRGGAAALARDAGLNPATIARARRQGRLSADTAQRIEVALASRVDVPLAAINRRRLMLHAGSVGSPDSDGSGAEDGLARDAAQPLLPPLEHVASVIYEVTDAYEQLNFTEDDRYCYWIGADDAGDRVEETRRTHVGRGEARRWRVIGAGMLGGPAVQGFVQLDLEATGTARHRVDALPITIRANTVQIVAFFLPPVQPGATLVWSLRYRWPGLWRPLRATGSDRGRIDFDARYTSRARICLIPSATAWRLSFSDRQPELGRVRYPSEKTVDGTPVPSLEWSVREPRQPLNFGVKLTPTR